MMAGLIRIAAVAAAGFYRCGQFWPREGRIVDPDTLDEQVLERLKSEPQLHLTPATGPAIEAAEAAALRGQIAAAFAALEPGDFAEDGTPRADAVRKALPKGTKGATAALVAEVWAEVRATHPPAA